MELIINFKTQSSSNYWESQHTHTHIRKFTDTLYFIVAVQERRWISVGYYFSIYCTHYYMEGKGMECQIRTEGFPVMFDRRYDEIALIYVCVQCDTRWLYCLVEMKNKSSLLKVPNIDLTFFERVHCFFASLCLIWNDVTCRRNLTRKRIEWMNGWVRKKKYNHNGQFPRIQQFFLLAFWTDATIKIWVCKTLRVALCEQVFFTRPVKVRGVHMNKSEHEKRSNNNIFLWMHNILPSRAQEIHSSTDCQLQFTQCKWFDILPSKSHSQSYYKFNLQS